jgi:hypothetical protein
MKIEYQCSCGASVVITADNTPACGNRLKEVLEDHKECKKK